MNFANNISGLSPLSFEETLKIDGGDVDGLMRGKGPDFQIIEDFIVGFANGFKAGVEAWGEWF